MRSSRQSARASALAKRYPDSASLIARELGTVSRAGPDTLLALREEHARYGERFGYTFIVSTTGKRAQDVLEVLRAGSPTIRPKS